LKEDFYDLKLYNRNDHKEDVMIRKKIFVILLIMLTANFCFAIQPKPGKWEANGTATANDNGKVDIEFTFDVSKDSFSIIFPGWVGTIRYEPSLNDPLKELKKKLKILPFLGDTQQERTTTITMPDGRFSYGHHDLSVEGKFVTDVAV
jgi:hypothetical protein